MQVSGFTLNPLNQNLHFLASLPGDLHTLILGSTHFRHPNLMHNYKPTDRTIALDLPQRKKSADKNINTNSRKLKGNKINDRWTLGISLVL